MSYKGKQVGHSDFCPIKVNKYVTVT